MSKMPVFVRSIGVGSSTALNKDLAVSFTAGQFLVYIGFGSDSGVTPTPPVLTGVTWTSRVSVLGFTGFGTLIIYTAPVNANVSGTLQARATWSGTGGNAFAWHCAVFTDVAGYIDWWTSRGSGAPTHNAIQREHNSIYYYGCVDWNVTDGATRTYRTWTGATFNEKHYNRDTAQTTYAGYWSGLGEPGDTTAYGMTVPATMKWTHAIIELYGPDVPKAYVKTATGMDPVTIVGLSKGDGTTESATITLT